MAVSLALGLRASAPWSAAYRDSMLDLTFGLPFDLVRTDETGIGASFIKDLLWAYGHLGASPWLFYMASTLTSNANKLSSFCCWCDRMIGGYKKAWVWLFSSFLILANTNQPDQDQPSLISWIQKAELVYYDEAQSRQWMYGDLMFAIAAGVSFFLGIWTYAVTSSDQELSHCPRSNLRASLI